MRCVHVRIQAIATIAAVLLLSACKGASGLASSSGLPTANLQAGQTSIRDLRPENWRGKIQHIIIVVQENRSFNNLFYGYPGAKTATYGYDSKKQKIALQPVGLETTWDLQHNAQGFLLSCNGAGKIPGTKCRMNGFDKQRLTCGGSGEPHCPNKYPEYSYVPHNETTPYFDMAKQYVLADQMFASDFDTSSFISHQYIITGQAPESAIDYPSTAWGCPGGSADRIAIVSKVRQFPHGYEVPCWDPRTLGDELDAAHLPWAFYASSGGNGFIWSAYQAINHIYNGPDWKNDVISPQTQFFNDVDNGKLRTVSWITPTYGNSDHGGNGSKTGPSWVTSIVNKVGQSKYWNSSAIFIFWDDSGGWYDPVPPPYVDYDGFGFRLPLLIISPYAKKGYVSHVQYEHGSILRFVEDQFGLASLSASDSRANSGRVDCFDFSQPPRTFVKINAPYDQAYFMRQPADHRSPDTQ